MNLFCGLDRRVAPSEFHIGMVPEHDDDACTLPRRAPRRSGYGINLSKAVTSSSLYYSANTSEFSTVSMQNAGVLSHARHLLRGANMRAKNYYQLAFVEEDMMEEDQEEEKLGDMLEVKEKWDEGKRRNLVDFLLEQENITDI